MEPDNLRSFKRMEIGELSSVMQEEVEEQYPPIRHPLINRYINYLGQRMAAYDSKMPDFLYKFYVLKTKDINSFSLPSGITYITLGFLSVAQKEEEVLGALAHELAHQKAQHAITLWKARTIGAASSFQKNTFHGDYFNSRYFGKNGFFYYGNGMEYEADRMAVQLLEQAGFHPRSMVLYLERLQEVQVSYPKRLLLWQSTQPDMRTRIQKLKLWLSSRTTTFPSKEKPKSSAGTFKEIKALLRTSLVPKNTSRGKNR